MTMIRLIGTVAATGLLAACGTLTVEQDVKALRGAEPRGTEFTQALTSGYRTFVIFESDEMYDWIDAAYFARKGLMAADGTVVEPEEPSNWRLPEHARSDILGAQRQLQVALRAGARDWAPRAAAQAQVNFDCWVEQQEEDWQREHIAACRNGFRVGMKDIEDAFKTRLGSSGSAPASSASTAPSPAPAATPAAPTPEPQRTASAAGTQLAIVFFDFDKAELTPEARGVIRSVLNSNGDVKMARIELAGHADRSGPDRYNDGLSTTRAESVKAELMSNGIVADRVTVQAFGEHQPMVSTPDGIREPLNRRVEIRVAPGG